MLRELQKKAVRRVVGMMSGTSVDGVDAAVVEIGGSAAAPQVKLLAFENRPYPRRCGSRSSAFSSPNQPQWIEWGI